MQFASGTPWWAGWEQNALCKISTTVFHGFGRCGGPFGGLIPANAGLVFNYTYDSSIPTAELTEVKSSMNFIAGEFSSAYTNNVTLNFTIAYDPSVDLAQSFGEL